MTAKSQQSIRDGNRRLVLETIVNQAPMSRAALSKKLHLTKATISNIIQELIDRQLVIELGSAETSMGRKPILLAFQKKCGFAVAVDIGVSKITILTSDLKGEDCAVKEYPFPSEHSFLTNLKDMLRHTIDGLPPSHYGVVGISIGIYGVVCQNEVVFTPYYHLPNGDLCQQLEDTFHIPVIIENDANLSVLGESAFHYGYKNMIYINIHDGIGMGILINGQLYKGHNGYAGEFGHTILYPHGRPCPCGNKGCFEQYASEKAILNEYAIKINRSSVTITDFLLDYQKGKAACIETMELFVEYMSIAVNNILNTFNADLIVINSSFSNYIPHIHQQIQKSLSALQHRDYRIIPSRLQDISGLIGGVRMSAEKFLDIPQLTISSKVK